MLRIQIYLQFNIKLKYLHIKHLEINMAIDFEALRKKLGQLSGTNSRRNMLWRPAQRLATHANAVRFAIGAIGPRAIDIVDMHRLGIKAKPTMISLDLVDKIE